MSRRILLFGGTVLADRLADKLATLPETYVCRNGIATNFAHPIDLAIICERSKGSRELWQTSPATEMASYLGYLYNAFWKVQSHEIPHLVTIGSACEYPATVATPYIPELLWDGWPDGDYRGAMLRILELFVKLQNDSGRLGHHIVLDSLYGPVDDFNENAALIPALIYRCTEALYKKHETVTINSDGKASRTFLHYDDAVEGILAVINNGRHFPGVINHGGDQQITVDKLATIIKNFVGFPGELVYDLSQSGGREESMLNCSLLQDGIGFKPVKRLIAGLEEVTRNYRQNYSA